MKTLKYNWIYMLVTLVSLGLSATETVGQNDYKREFSEEYSVGSSGEVSISNRYGNVDIKTWNQDKVVIDVEVIVEAKSESKAEKVFDRISISFSETGGIVKGETRIQSSNNWNNGSKFKINYDVKMPKGHDLDLSNKYGDVFVDELGGDIKLTLKYGNGNLANVQGEGDLYLGYVDRFRMEDITGKLRLEAAYSDLSCGNVGNADIESKYSDLRFDNMGDLVVESKYDDYAIKSASSIDYRGKYDDYEIGSVGRFDAKTKYTDIEVDYLNGDGRFDLSYGSIDVRSIESGTNEVDITGGYTDVELGVDGAYRLNFDGRYTSTSFGDDLTVNQREKSKNEVYIRGYHGKKSAKLLIIADMNYGSFDLN